MMSLRLSMIAGLLAALSGSPAFASDCIPHQAGMELPGPSVGRKASCKDGSGECTYVVRGTEIGVSEGTVVRKEARATDPALRLPFGERGGVSLADFILAYAKNEGAPSLAIGANGRQIIVSTDMCLLSAAKDVYELAFNFNAAGRLTSVVERILYP
jgi:hypothetical protein